jgi:hypothetical protein
VLSHLYPIFQTVHIVKITECGYEVRTAYFRKYDQILGSNGSCVFGECKDYVSNELTFEENYHKITVLGLFEHFFD